MYTQSISFWKYIVLLEILQGFAFPTVCLDCDSFHKTLEYATMCLKNDFG